MAALSALPIFIPEVMTKRHVGPNFPFTFLFCGTSFGNVILFFCALKWKLYSHLKYISFKHLIVQFSTTVLRHIVEKWKIVLLKEVHISSNQLSTIIYLSANEELYFILDFTDFLFFFKWGNIKFRNHHTSFVKSIYIETSQFLYCHQFHRKIANKITTSENHFL